MAIHLEGWPAKFARVCSPAATENNQERNRDGVDGARRNKPRRRITNREATPDGRIRAARKTYDGLLVVGEDLMQFEIGEEVTVTQNPPTPPPAGGRPAFQEESFTRLYGQVVRFR